MNSNVLKEYLVSLGFKVDHPGLDKWRVELNKLDAAARALPFPWLRAAATISSALASVTLATTGLLDHLAQTDLEFKKFALRMYMGEDAAKRLRMALDAMGESLDDIAWIPELRERYKGLIELEKSFAPPDEYEMQMRHLRDIRFEFTKLKVELAYGAQWVGSYLYRYLNEEIHNFDGQLRGLNDWLLINLPVWTDKIAHFLQQIIQLGESAFRSIRDLAGSLERLWDELDPATHMALAGAGLLALFGVAGPFGKALIILSALILLIDDFYAWIDGRKSVPVLAPIWGEFLAVVRMLNNGLHAMVEAFGAIRNGDWGKAGSILGDAFRAGFENSMDAMAAAIGPGAYKKMRQMALRGSHGAGQISDSEYEESLKGLDSEYEKRVSRYHADTEANKKRLQRKPAGAGVVGGYDISSYATDPNHERSVARLYSDIASQDMKTAQELDAYIQSAAPGSPLTGEMVLNSAQRTGVDPSMMLAIMMQDSSLGTRGKGFRTFNPGNVGNDDAGNLRNYGSWQEGVNAVGDWLSRHRAAQRTGVDPSMTLAIMMQDSSLGTRGKGSRTFNPGNVGNDDAGNLRNYGSWQEGVNAVGDWLSRHRAAQQSYIRDSMPKPPGQAESQQLSQVTSVGSVNVNVAGSNASPEEIGRTVKQKILEINNQNQAVALRGLANSVR